MKPYPQESDCSCRGCEYLRWRRIATRSKGEEQRQAQRVMGELYPHFTDEELDAIGVACRIQDSAP